MQIFLTLVIIICLPLRWSWPCGRFSGCGKWFNARAKLRQGGGIWLNRRDEFVYRNVIMNYRVAGEVLREKRRRLSVRAFSQTKPKEGN